MVLLVEAHPISERSRISLRVGEIPSSGLMDGWSPKLSPSGGTSYHRGVVTADSKRGKSHHQAHAGWLYLQNVKMKQYFILKMQYNEFGRVYTICMKAGSSVDHPVLSDHVLFLGRWGVRPPRNHLRSEDILLEEVLLDELYQVSLEGPAMDGLVPLTVVVRAALL